MWCDSRKSHSAVITNEFSFVGLKVVGNFVICPKKFFIIF